MKIEKINQNDKYYPKNLLEIYNPPKQLYILGNKEILNSFNIAIIGCRLNSKYGENVAKELACKLSKLGIVITSGLAKGIDSYSHIGCLNAGGKTIAVLGSGFYNIYPKENIKIAKQIVEKGGVIISEYNPEEKPKKENFPSRNRIISGISNGVVVVEAKEKSGTFITVDLALEQGKNIFAVPGNILSKNSQGTNELIKQGAKIVTKVEDIIEEYKIL